MKRSIAAAILVATSAFAQPGVFELKGLRMGMTETEFVAINGSAVCALNKPPAANVAGLPERRLCRVDGYTVGGNKTGTAHFDFYAGQLGGMSFSFRSGDTVGLRDGLVAKYGEGQVGGSPRGTRWTIGDVQMFIGFDEMLGVVRLSADSEQSRKWYEQRSAAEASAAKKDL